MTSKEIREKETDHLKHELEEKRKHLFDLRTQAVTEKLEDPSQLRKTRKDIARMVTILKQRDTKAETTAETKAEPKAQTKEKTKAKAKKKDSKPVASDAAK